MKLKRYEAPSLPEALKVIRRDLGPNAIIVHTQQIRQKGLLGFLGRPVFEVIAAIDPEMPPRTVDRVQPAINAIARHTNGGQVAGARGPGTGPRAPGPGGKGQAAGNAASATGAGRGEPTPDPRPLAPGPPPPAGVALDAVQRDLHELKGAVSRLANQSQLLGIYKFAPGLVNLYQALLDQELDPALAQQIIHSIRDELSDRALTDRRAIEDSLCRFVQRLLPAIGPLQPGRGTAARPLLDRPDRCR